MTTDASGLSNPEEAIVFPWLFDAVDRAAAESQRKLLRFRRLELASLVGAAALAELPGSVLGGAGPVGAFLLFGLALVMRVSGSDASAERNWYEGRAAAESLKSMSWQYAVAGESFRLGEDGVASRFREEMRKILKELPDLDIPAESAETTAIPQQMTRLRDAPRHVRTERYLELRVKDQLAWYNAKAKWNKRRAAQWRGALIGVEALAVILGLGRVVGAFDVDWLGVFASLAAALAAWQQTKNYQGLSQSYAVTSHDVLLVSDSLGSEPSEAAWAQAVHDSEAAFSREHTLWRARRQGPSVS